jgi:hypothetical protein
MNIELTIQVLASFIFTSMLVFYYYKKEKNKDYLVAYVGIIITLIIDKFIYSLSLIPYVIVAFTLSGLGLILKQFILTFARKDKS